MTLSKPTDMSADSGLSSSPKEGSLLRIIRPGGIWCEPDLWLQSYRRYQAYSKFSSEVQKRCQLEIGAIVLCLGNEIHPILGIRILRFFYEERCYTFKGYYLPKDYFEVVVAKDVSTGP